MSCTLRYTFYHFGENTHLIWEIYLGKIRILYAQYLYFITVCDIIYGRPSLGSIFFLSSKIRPTSCYSLPDKTNVLENGGVYHPPPKGLGPGAKLKKFERLRQLFAETKIVEFQEFHTLISIWQLIIILFLMWYHFIFSVV